ncbi:MAG: tetratricopeptide repeat protein [Candidatus Omnitrophota bacterium]
MPNGTKDIRPQAQKEVLPEEIKDYYDKGVAAIRRENYDYAIELLTSTLALKQDFAEARFYLWLALRKKLKRSPDPLKIKKIIRKIVGFFLRLRGISLKRGGKTWEAIYQLERAMRVDPNSIGTLNAIADCFLSEGQTLNAIKILEAVPQIDNKNVKALKKLGNLYMEIEDYEKARAYFQATLRADPSDIDAEHGLKNLDALKTLKGSFPTEEKK